MTSLLPHVSVGLVNIQSKWSSDHSGYGLSQWETTLHCNVVSHCLSRCPELSLVIGSVAWQILHCLNTNAYSHDTLLCIRTNSSANTLPLYHITAMQLFPVVSPAWLGNKADLFTPTLYACDVMTWHYNDVIISAMASQITSLTIGYSAVYSGTDERKHQSSASLAFVRGIHRGPVNSPHKCQVTRKMFPIDDVIMENISCYAMRQ